MQHTPRFANRLHHLGIALMLLGLSILCGWPANTMAEDHPGKAIYEQKCAMCHGADGAGTKDVYPEPLVGDRSVAELADFIAETMPDGAEEECVGEEAKHVAAYIHEAFYSPAAQVRNQPPTIEFSRLTVRQYENAVADLLGSFRSPGQWDDERGLNGEYFNSRRFRRNKRVFERRDATIEFHFGTSSPEPEKIDAEEFSIRWRGSLLAPETGEYEFILESENGLRLWVNDTEQALIDAWVRSGDETERRQSIRLLGGRTYPLRLEFFKSKQDESASITLKWKPPHSAEELIPERNLAPHRSPETYVLETAFPPDDRNAGYERGTSISKAWHQSTTYAAIEVARAVVDDLNTLANCPDNAPDREQRLRTFCRQFAERAFRRPLTDEQQAFFVDQQFERAPDFETAVKRTVLLVLKSPRFLYREVGVGPFDDYDVASWMSFGLWDSLPDQPLLDAAANGQLQTREQIARHAQRMLADLRAKAKLRDFLHLWLKLDRLHDLDKDAEQFPEFDERIASDLRVSLNLFLEDVVWSETSDFRQLLLADELYLNGRLAQFYGVDLPEGAPFQKISLEPEQRAGLLSHPYLMAGFAHRSSSSPIHRGVFLVRSVLGRFLKPPPEAVTPIPPDLHPNLTTRERVTLQTNSQSCQRCHNLINPLGFSLEHFDAVGRYRSQETGRPIDATGSYRTRSGQVVEFTGARELAAFLADSEETHQAFIEQLFQYTVKQPIQAFGPESPAKLRQSFADHNFNIQHLLAEIITESAITVKKHQP